MRKLHPATVIVALIPALREAFRTCLPVIIGAFVSGHHAGGDWVAGLFAFLTGSFAVGAYWTTRFDIAADQVIHKTGWIFRKERRIPLQQIQNVNIRQNVLERLFKVATVDVETAMGHGRDLKLSVLGFHDAERVREELLGSPHIDPTVSVSSEAVVARLTAHDLLFGAITENHLPQILLAMVTLGGPGVGLVMQLAGRFSSTAQPLLVCGSVILLLVGGWLWGAGGYFLKYGGFVVHKSESTFRITYGLLNKAQLAIRPKRIEFVHITVTILQRLMGRASLHLGTAASFGEAGVYAPVGLFVEREVAYAGAREVIPNLDIAQLNWKPFHPVFYRARFARSTISILVMVAIAFGLSRGTSAPVAVWIVCYLLAAIVFLQLVALLLAMPENGFSITGDALVVRSGFYHQSISAMPILRMETMWLSRPFWWQRYRATRLIVQAMNRKIVVGAIPDADIEMLMSSWRELADSIEAQKVYALDSDLKTIGQPEDRPIEGPDIA